MLTLDDKHVYRVDGRVVPGVSAVLHAAGMLKGVEFIDPWYAQRGTAVHKAAALWDRGMLDEDSVDPAIAPYLTAWRAFVTMNRHRLEFTEIESQHYHETYGYAGTRDRIGLWDGKPCVWDLKCGGKMPFHAIQLAAYAELEDNGATRLAVHLESDGSWKLQTYSDREDWTVFASGLALYQWRARNGLLPKENDDDR